MRIPGFEITPQGKQTVLHPEQKKGRNTAEKSEDVNDVMSPPQSNRA